MEISFFKIIFIALCLQVSPVLHEPVKNKKKSSVKKFFSGKNSNTSDSTSTSASDSNGKDNTSQTLKTESPVISSNYSENKNPSQTMKLDKNTNKWSFPKNKLEHTFEPPVFPMERIGVLNRFSLNYKGRIIAEDTSSGEKELAQMQVLPKSTAFRYYDVTYNISTRNKKTPVPSVAPYMLFKPQKGSAGIYKNSNDVFFIKSRQNKPVKFKIAVPESYFHLKIPNTKLSLKPSWKGAATLRKLARKYVGRYKNAKTFIPSFIKYLRSFKVKPLSDHAGMSLTEALLKQKKGVCRHRSLIFAAILAAYGIKSRVVYNNIHAFTEIKFPNGKWMQVDLGGAVIPPEQIAAKRKVRYTYNATSSKTAFRGTVLHIELSYTRKPPVLWISLIKKITGGTILIKPLFPSEESDKFETELKIPFKISPGKYILKITSEKPVIP